MTARFRAITALAVCFSQLIRAQQAASPQPQTGQQPAQSQTSAAPPAIDPVPPQASVLTRPYRQASVPSVRLSNSDRLSGMIRAGKLYLSPSDAIVLALENNIDIEVARYSPLLLASQLKRSEAGGALPGVPSGSSQANSVTSGQGVLGSQAAAGVSGGGSGGGSNNTSNATISQIGPVTQTLDPSIQEASTFSHRTSLQANLTQSLTFALDQDARNHSATFQAGFLTGGSASLTFRDSYLKEGAATDLLNPSVAQSLNLQVSQNLLQGRGRAVNARNITVAKNNLAMSDLNFETTILQTLAVVLNSYWTLVGDYEDLKAKQEALDTASRFVGDNQKRVDLGDLAPVDLISSRNQLATAKLAVVTSQTALQQNELQLKNLISRNGVADPVLAGVSIVPTGTITIPDVDDTPPVKALVTRALKERSDLKATEGSLRNTEVSNLGTTNGLLPTLQVFGAASNSGLAGDPHTVFGQNPDPYFVGGAGTALGQVFRRNFPTESAGAFVRLSVNNRQAQADYGIDQLQYRQSQLLAGRDRNQVEVDVTNSVVAIRQARARYDAARSNRILQEQLLDGEQKKFALGESTSFNVIQQQRDLSTSKATELSALVSFQLARIYLDAITGAAIDANGITLSDVQAGHIRQ
jgi:outer membrane protein